MLKRGREGGGLERDNDKRFQDERVRGGYKIAH